MLQDRTTDNLPHLLQLLQQFYAISYSTQHAVFITVSKSDLVAKDWCQQSTNIAIRASVTVTRKQRECSIITTCKPRRRYFRGSEALAGEGYIGQRLRSCSCCLTYSVSLLTTWCNGHCHYYHSGGLQCIRYDLSCCCNLSAWFGADWPNDFHSLQWKHCCLNLD